MYVLPDENKKVFFRLYEGLLQIMLRILFQKNPWNIKLHWLLKGGHASVPTYIQYFGHMNALIHAVARIYILLSLH